MAQLLIEQWRLAVLRVRLDLSEREPAVATELVHYPQGEPVTVRAGRYPLTAFGLGGADTPGALVVPDALTHAVGGALGGEFGGEAALWLRLVPPYGYLGAVPWERAMGEHSDVPMLRVPDRLPAAADPGWAWTVAIALNAAPGSAWAAPYVSSFVESLRQQAQTTVVVHVFADAATHAQLAPIASELVVVHDPGKAKAAGSDAGPRLWADWIVRGLEGRAMRALHVVTDAVFDADHPMLGVSTDPAEPADWSRCGYVSADEVGRLADTVGAAVLSFGSPPGNPSDVATRVAADACGLRRQGPTLYSAIELDPGGHALASAHAFLANQPGTTPVPHHPSLFAHLQPEHVAAALTDAWPTEPGPPPTTSSGDDVSAFYEGSEWVPSWVAASERFIDTKVADIVRTTAPDGDESSTRSAYNRGTASAVSELRELIARHARQS